MAKSKVIVMFVEGPSDHDTLGIPLENYCNNANKRIRLEIEYGCKLTQFNNDKNKTNRYLFEPGNVISELSKCFKDKLLMLKNELSIYNKDISNLIYCVDLDDCFINNESKEELANKAKCLLNLFKATDLTVNKKLFKFNVIFFSKDLESVFHKVDGSTLDDEFKKKLSKKIISAFNNNENILLELISINEIVVWPTFDEGYESIIDCDKSATNLNLLINKIIKSVE